MFAIVLGAPIFIFLNKNPSFYCPLNGGAVILLDVLYTHTALLPRTAYSSLLFTVLPQKKKLSQFQDIFQKATRSALSIDRVGADACTVVGSAACNRTTQQ